MVHFLTSSIGTHVNVLSYGRRSHAKLYIYIYFFFEFVKRENSSFNCVISYFSCFIFKLSKEGIIFY